MSRYDDLLNTLISFKGTDTGPEQEIEHIESNAQCSDGEDLHEPQSVNERDPQSGRSRLHQACIDGDKELVKQLLQDTELNLSLRTMLGGLTGLHLAVSGNHRSIVFQLLSNGADALARDRFGCSPMHYVRSVSVAKLLAQYGARVLDYNAKRKNALDSVLLRSSMEDVDANDQKSTAATKELVKFMKQIAEVEYKARMARLRELKQQAKAQQEDMKSKRRERKSLKDLK